MGDAKGSELELMVDASGKMVLLHKLLPKLKAEGRKVRCSTLKQINEASYSNRLLHTTTALCIKGLTVVCSQLPWIAKVSVQEALKGLTARC